VIRALLWDVDGTLAETERDGHLVAFNRAFAALEVPWRWSAEHYGRLLAVAGGHERLLHDMQSQPQAPAHLAQRASLARAIHRLKNEIYAAIVRAGELPLRAGVTELMADCLREQVAMGIATTSSRRNVEALLAYHLGGKWREHFHAVVSGAEAPRKKPDPQVYHLALAALRLQPAECVAVEDAPAGVEACRRAGVAVIVTRSHYFPAAAGACAAGPSLGSAQGWEPAPAPGAQRIGLEQIRSWSAAPVRM
jgi:HAD superfamily hydrolase (TIGR01509 family)